MCIRLSVTFESSSGIEWTSGTIELFVKRARIVTPERLPEDKELRAI